VKLRVATRTLRTIQKKGLGAYARELGINLAKI
jgi:large subunit ribosomal protein L28